jgi:hypothetical protein
VKRQQQGAAAQLFLHHQILPECIFALGLMKQSLLHVRAFIIAEQFFLSCKSSNAVILPETILDRSTKSGDLVLISVT